jgi:hypothetical protein
VADARAQQRREIEGLERDDGRVRHELRSPGEGTATRKRLSGWTKRAS